MKKICRICGKLKELVDFHKKKGTSDGHRNECKECVKVIKLKYLDKEKQADYDKRRYEENRDKVLERKKEYHIENREEILKKKKEYRNNINNKEKAKDYSKEYREKNPDYGKNYIKEYKKNNREKYYEYRRNNPHIIAWRSILYTLKRLGTNKSGHTIDELGYSADELKVHIESLFLPTMTWDNHGVEWHIDHIKPVSSFDKGADIKIVCALSNLQPLWITTREIDGIIYEGNLNKGNKY